MKRILLALALIPQLCLAARADFREGATAYKAGDYSRAAILYRNAAARQPAAGTFQNLGNAEWQSGNAGSAIVAWERSLWVNPLNESVRNNLSFARKTAQLDAPDLAWYEVVSTWLPARWWAWILVLSFWLTVAATLLPGIFRWNGPGWRQGVAAFGLTLFLLSLPAQAGVYTRSRLGFIVLKQTPLRLTPTSESQVLMKMQAGEPARLVRRRGKDLLLKTTQGLGWVSKEQFELVCSS